MSDIGNINDRPERVYPGEHFIDATPDGQYAIRILRHYRELCNMKWSDVTDGDPTNPVIIELNKHCDMRANELDKAIKILEEAYDNENRCG